MQRNSFGTVLEQYEEENQSINNRFRNNTDDGLRQKDVKIAAVNIFHMLSMYRET